MMWKLLAVALMGLSIAARAQSGAVDSALAQIRQHPDDTAKVKLYEALFYDEDHFAHYEPGNLDQQLAYLTEMLQLSQRLGYKRGIAEGYNCTGIVYSWMAQSKPKKSTAWRKLTNTALENYYKARDVFNEAGYRYNSGGTAANIGMLIFRTGHTQRGLDTLLVARQLLAEFGGSVFLANTLDQIGVVYHSRKNYAEALDYQLAAKNLYEAAGKRRYLSMVYARLADNLLHQKRYDAAKAYATQALELAPESSYAGARETAQAMLDTIEKRRK